MDIVLRLGVLIALETLFFAIGYIRGHVVTFKESNAILLGILLAYAIWYLTPIILHTYF